MKRLDSHIPSPLLVPAVALSGASLAWTTWSLVDLLGAGHIGLTVAAGADVIWASVILAEARGLRITLGGRNIVPAIGWLALVLVAGLLAWHGIDRDSVAMAVAGPFLPLGAKAVWLLALADMRDPAALTEEERHTLARMERGMAFEEARHRIELRHRAMAAELQLADLSTDFDIELTRQDKARELSRRRPLEIPAPTPAEPVVATVAEHPTAPADEPSAVDLAPHASSFGFAAALPPTAPVAKKPVRRQRPARKTASTPARIRRSMPEWVELAAPVLAAETAARGTRPSGPEFAKAIASAGLGTVSASTAKNIRAAIEAEQ